MSGENGDLSWIYLFIYSPYLALFSVFEEKNLDGDGLDNVLNGVHSDGQKRLLVASRHARNDSRGIQLEMRYGSDGETAPKLPFKKSHIRSSSCDVRFMRDFENDCKYLKVPKKCHSRTSSRDMEQEFRKRFSHNTNSDHLNIKCIINYLKSGPKNNGMLNEEADRASGSSLCVSGGGGGSCNSSRRGGHSRNHSYDRIYTANNNEAFLPDYLDQPGQSEQPLEQHGNKDVNVRRGEELMMGNSNKFLIAAPAAVAIELLVPASFESKYTHSRNNSKDFNVKLDDFAGLGSATGANLRHRRTSSKDMNVVGAAAVGSHRRNSSQQRIQMEGEDDGAGSAAITTTTNGQSLLHFNNKSQPE